MDWRKKSFNTGLFYKGGVEITVGDRVRGTTSGWYGTIDFDKKGELIVKGRTSQFLVRGREHKIKYVGR